MPLEDAGRQGRAGTVGALAAGCATTPSPGAAAPAVAAVDHVQEVLADAGLGAPGIVGLVRYDCGPTDAVLGIRVSDQPVTVEVPWQDLAPVVAERGGELPPPSEDPLAGMPAHVDRYEVTGDGWAVRWGSSNAVLLGDAPATTVTVDRERRGDGRGAAALARRRVARRRLPVRVSVRGHRLGGSVRAWPTPTSIHRCSSSSVPRWSGRTCTQPVTGRSRMRKGEASPEAM